MRESLRPRIWAAVRTLHGRQDAITAAAVRELLTGAPAGCLHRIRAYLRSLADAGYLAVVPRAQVGETVIYLLVRDTGHEAPRIRLDGTAIAVASGRERMWAVMRVLRSFTALDLAVHASVDDHVVAESDASHYCRSLARAGFLRVVKPGTWRLNSARWRGPQPPRLRRDKHIHDPNTNTLYTPAGEVVTP